MSTNRYSSGTLVLCWILYGKCFYLIASSDDGGGGGGNTRGLYECSAKKEIMHRGKNDQSWRYSSCQTGKHGYLHSTLI